MIRAFLSHSSKDKNSYVKFVADKIGIAKCVYDEYTFEAGMPTLEEILKGLDSSQLFVIFLSQNALESVWVKREILEAKQRFDDGFIKRIYPIIIDNTINHKDPRIPKWLKDEYNIRNISQPHTACRLIKQRLRELSWNNNPELQQRQQIFVGRNDQLKAFENRIDDIDSSAPIAAIASGLPKIGRKTFLHQACIKSTIYSHSYNPQMICLEQEDSIEDFMLKIFSLGYTTDESIVTGLTDKTIADKINDTIKLIGHVQNNNDIILIEDRGCLINYQRQIATWFQDLCSNSNLEKKLIFGIASKYRFKHFSSSSRKLFLFIEIPDLCIKEREGLFKRYLDLFNIKIDNQDFHDFTELFYGYPDQILFCVELLRELGVTAAKKQRYQLQEFNSEKASIITQELTEDEHDFIRLLAEFEIISLEFLFDIVDENIYFPILNKMLTKSICDYVSAERDFIRLNDVIRDYIIRHRVRLPKRFYYKIIAHVKEFIEDDDKLGRDSSDYSYSIRKALTDTEGNIESSLLSPSHFLKSMKDLYYRKKYYKKVIQLADIILQKECFLDKMVVDDIRYYLCLSLARQKDKRTLQEVQKIRQPGHNFIKGYYYRQVGRHADAINILQMLTETPYISARAKRELVNVYLAVEEFDKAFSMARENYEENKNNIFHIHAYFNCIINGSEPNNSKRLLFSLLEEMKTIEVSPLITEIIQISQAVLLAKCNHNEFQAINQINDCINAFPDSHYPLLAKSDIAILFRNKTALAEAINGLEIIRKNHTISTKTLAKARAYQCAFDGQTEKALTIINKNTHNYPQEARERLINSLKTISNNT